MIDRLHDYDAGSQNWGGWNNRMTSPCISSANVHGGANAASLGYPEWDGWASPYTEQYIEARIFFGPGPTTWPAFWTLSDGPGRHPITGEWGVNATWTVPTQFDPEVIANGTRSGFPYADELDIVEAWMPQVSHSLNTHMWGYEARDRGNKSFAPDHPFYPLGVGEFDTREIHEEAGAEPLVGDFCMGFQTHAVYITRDYTYYFVNGLEIARHRTFPMSWRDGNRVLINTGLDTWRHRISIGDEPGSTPPEYPLSDGPRAP